MIALTVLLLEDNRLMMTILMPSARTSLLITARKSIPYALTP